MKIKLPLFAILVSLCAGSNLNAQSEALVTINPGNGSFEIVNTLPTVNYIAVYPNFTTFDQNGKRYIFKGKDFSGNLFLYSVNVTLGNIISSPAFPLTDDNPDKIIELQYDNSSNTIYMLCFGITPRKRNR